LIDFSLGIVVWCSWTG